MHTDSKDIHRKTTLLQKVVLVLAGLFVALLFLEVGLRIGGTAILALQEYRNQRSIRQKGVYRILCLGESTTQNQYPSYLEEYLNQSNSGIKFSVIDKGLAARKTTVILSQLEANIDRYNPDMIVVMMGINDSGDQMPYDADSASKVIQFFRSLRVYKMCRFIWLNMSTRELTQIRQSSDKTAALDVENDFVFEGWTYRKQGKYAQAEQSFKKAMALDPNNDSAFEGLGWIIRRQKKFAEAEQLFKKAIALNPDNISACEGLGWVYKDQCRYNEAEQLFRKAIVFDPDNDSVFAGLGWVCTYQGKYAQAEQSFKKAMALDPNNDSAFEGLGWSYKDQGRFEEAEQLFKKAIALNSHNYSAYRELVWTYMAQGKLIEAQQKFTKAMELNPNDEIFCRLLATIYFEMGNRKLSEFYSAKANDLRIKYYNPMTIANYRKLKQIAEERKIKLICAQYPVRSVEPLKKLFGEEADGMVFVDNERIFKEAIGREGFRTYFRDIFAEDFGHCTDKGNKLLAKNIANVILKEVFNLPIEKRAQ